MRRGVKHHLKRGFQIYQKIKIYFNKRVLYLPLEKIKVEKPVFLLGVQRGGLTIISRSLRRHPKVVTMRGNNKYWTGQDELMQQPGIPKELSINKPEDGKNVYYDKVFGNERLWWTYATDRLFQTYYSDEKNYSKKLDREFKRMVKRFMRAYAYNPKKSRYVEKSQLFSIKIKLINKIFPDAKFILVTRNPYAICWRQSVGKYNQNYRRWNKKPSQEEALKYAAQHYKNNMGTALKDLKEINKGIVVKIEDYLENPEKELKRILDYCELEYKEDLLPAPNQKLPFGSLDESKWYPLKKDINSKYLDKMSQKEKETIVGEIGIKLIKNLRY